MPKKRRISMRKAREIIRLKWGQNMTNRQIAASCRISPSTVTDCMNRAKVYYPLPKVVQKARCCYEAAA
jgi:DNA-binding CsgD family transcriptional regulator